MNKTRPDESLKHYGNHGIPYYAGHEPEYDQGDWVVVAYDDLYDLYHDYLLLRKALVGLVGIDGREELKDMEATLRAFHSPADDKAVAIDAVHALTRTLDRV